MAIFVALLGLVLVLVLVLSALSCLKYNTWRSKGVPYLTPIPLFGNCLANALQLEPLFLTFDKLYKKFPKEPFVGLYAGPSPVLLVKDLEAVKSVTVKDFSNFTDHKLSPSSEYDKTFSNFLFCLNGDEWKKLRVKMTPGFSSGRLKSMYPQVKAVAGQFIRGIEKKKTQDGTIAINTMCTRYGIDVIAQCAFGVQSDSLGEDDRSPFLNAVADAFRFGTTEALGSFALLFSNFAYHLLKIPLLKEWRAVVLRDLLRQSSEHRERDQQGSAKDIFDSLLQLKRDGDVPHEVFEAQVMSMQVAGSETSASTLMFCLWMLSLHRDCQDKLREELRSALISKGTSDLTYDIIHETEYLEMVFKETLRLWPIMPWLDRVASQDYTFPGTNVRIEKGTTLFIPNYSIQRDPEHFQDPRSFNPERFSPENRGSTNKLAFMPFGVGPRACIGSRFAEMSVKSALSTIILAYEVLPTKGTPRSEDELPISPKGFIITLSKELPLQFKRL